MFRADIPTKFRLNPKGYQGLIDSLDDDLRYALKTEGKGMTPEDCDNYDEFEAIVAKLADLRDVPTRDADAADLPPRRRGDVPEHHPHEPAPAPA